MPAIEPGSKVLLTGASGYIAAHTAKAFLDAGYPVRGTVRSKEKGEYLANLFKDSKVPFEYVIVEDIAKPGAFDEAVKGVDAVAHTASPFHMKADEPDELIKPAVQGTLGVLESLKKNNPDVKRVVITSSVAAVVDDSVPKPHHFDEKDWNQYSLDQVKEKGRDATPGDKYRASKTLAEKAFWKFLEDNKPAFDGATINPPLVLGPLIQDVKSTKDVNESASHILNWFTGNKSQSDIPEQATFTWVDVRDVAQAHVKALTVPEAGGIRFITANGITSPNDWVLIFEKHFPDRKTYPKGDASKREKINSGVNTFDGSKAKKVLGINYTDMDKSVYDTTKSLIDRLGI